MTDRPDDFERRFSDEFRAYLADNVPTTDPTGVAESVVTGPTPPRARWAGPRPSVGGMTLTAMAVLVIVVVRLGTPPVASPSPSTLGSPPAAIGTTEPGEILISCDTPIVPGWCLQPVAWAIQHLPSGHAPVASVTIMPINLCPDASPCVGPPHQDESWADFTMRDGTHLGMWVVRIMGMPHVQSTEVDGTPPPSAEPVTGSMTLACGDIPDATCAGAAGGATDVVPNKPPRTVLVQPGQSDRLVVTVTYVDGTQATTDVAPDSTRAIGWSSVSDRASPTAPEQVSDSVGGVTFTRPATWFGVRPPENVTPGPFWWLSSDALSATCPMESGFPIECLPGGILRDGGVLIIFRSGAVLVQTAPTPLPLGTFASDECTQAGGRAVGTRVGTTYIQACMRGESAEAAFDLFFRSLSQSAP